MLALGIRTPDRLARFKRARARGFTLIELMVVVVLIAILAMLAVPGMRTARDDRMAFDYARQIQQMIAHARTRAVGRGGAQLIVLAPSGTRGKVWLWEALDNIPGPVPPGPNPVSSCKTLGQWAGIEGYVPGVTPKNALNRIVEGIDLNGLGINVDADIRANFFMSDPVAPTTLAAAPVVAMCVTPNGTVYAASASDIPAAVVAMQSAPPFTGVIDVRVTRNSAGAPVGLTRHVMVAGAAAPRIQSR